MMEDHAIAESVVDLLTPDIVRMHRSLCMENRPARAYAIIDLADKRGAQCATKIRNPRAFVRRLVEHRGDLVGFIDPGAVEGKPFHGLDLLVVPLPVRATQELYCTGCKRPVRRHRTEVGFLSVTVIADRQVRCVEVPVVPGIWPAATTN